MAGPCRVGRLFKRLQLIPTSRKGGGGGGAMGTDSAFDEKALIMSQHYVATTLDLCIASSAPR